jgi:hypothetical protein
MRLGPVMSITGCVQTSDRLMCRRRSRVLDAMAKVSKRRLVKRSKAGRRHQIFISHSHRDQAAVDRIAERLEAEGHEVWVDRLELKPGDNFQRKIHDGLRQADVLLVVLSENSFRSEWVQHEFTTIVLQDEISERKRRVIPIRIDDVPVPGYIAHLLYLDFSQDFDAGLNRLVVELRTPTVGRARVAGARARTSSEAGETQIRALSDALRRGRLTLVCGAGVSVAAGVPSWNRLLLRLLDRLMERLSKKHSLDLDKATAQEFQKSYATSSSLILGKYLKNNLGDEFAVETRQALYSGASKGSDLINSIVELARPQRDSKALDSIITFNFDCLIEEGLGGGAIACKSIFSESIRHDGNQLPIYHVHGFLPRDGSIPLTELVFSEDAYHSQFIDAFSWSNLIQLNKLTQNTCLFIGISLTDPNMRRLLDVAWRKSADKKRAHFIVKKGPDYPKDSELDRVTRLLEEQDANALGLNVIWIDSFDELPRVIRSIAQAGT